MDSSSRQREQKLEMPVGGHNTRALSSPRPALKMIREALPEELRQHISSGRELRRRQRRSEDPPLITAEPALDRLLAGGLARGRLVELVGRRSSGRLSLALTALAAATGIGEAAALIDLGDGLDPQAAAAAGVDLDRLLWLRPHHLKQALGSAEMVIGCGFPLVVLELGLPPVRGGRGTESAWRRLGRACEEHRSALLVSAPYRVSGTAADSVLQAAGEHAVWWGRGAAPRLLAGLTCRLSVDKQRGSAPGDNDALLLRSPATPQLPRARWSDSGGDREERRETIALPAAVTAGAAAG